MAEQLGFQDWYMIFDLVSRNSSAEIEDARKLIRKHRTTAGRALGIAKYLIERGPKPLDEETVDRIIKNVGYGTTSRFVSDAYYHYLNWSDNYEDKQLVKKLHIESLQDKLKELRSCLEHPTLNNQPDCGLINFRGCDWRLDPIAWFFLSTPDIDLPDWGPDFALFKSHTVASPFWEHLEQLKEMVKALIDGYDRAVASLSSEYDSFKNFWEEVQIKRARWDDYLGGRPSRTSLYPNIEDEFEPEYEQEIINDAMSIILKASSEDLFQLQIELEEMLDQLYDDLLPDEINPIIVKGHCEKCPK